MSFIRCCSRCRSRGRLVLFETADHRTEALCRDCIDPAEEHLLDTD